MANLKELRNKINVIGSTKKVTSAMKLVSGVKLRKAEELAISSKKFTKDFIDIFNNIDLELYNDKLPEILSGRENIQRALLIIVSSERGLCGNFNYLVAKKAEEVIRGYHARNIGVDVKCIGKKVFDIVKKFVRVNPLQKKNDFGMNFNADGREKTADGEVKVSDLSDDIGNCVNNILENNEKDSVFSRPNSILDENFDDEIDDDENILDALDENIDKKFDTIELVVDFFKSNVSYVKADVLSNIAQDFFMRKIADEVKIIFTEYITTNKRVVVVRNLIPIMQFCDIKSVLSKDVHLQESRENNYILYEPNEKKVLELILPYIISIQIYQACLDSFACEHSARMIAMNNATNNAEEMFNKMTVVYNRTRQGMITQELVEIVSGAESLGK